MTNFVFYRLKGIKEWIDANDPNAIVIPFSGALEQKLVDMPEDEAAKYCTDNNVGSSLPKVIVNGYKALHLQYFFTCGPDEVRAWTIHVRKIILIMFSLLLATSIPSGCECF
jgi:obg-like ATPase 1